ITGQYAPRRERLWPTGLTATERLRHLVAEAGARGLDVRDLPVRLGLAPPVCAAAVHETPELVVVAGRIVTTTLIADLERRAIDVTRAFHQAHPLEPGIPAHALRAALHGAPEVV